MRRDGERSRSDRRLESARRRAVEFQLDVVIIMRDPPARRDGRWLMTPAWTPGGEITHHPANWTGPPAFPSTFRDIELLVTAFPGCRTRFFLPITTCHATASRISFSFSLSLFPGFILLPRPYRSRFSASGWSSPLLSPVSLSRAPRPRRAQSPISNDYARRSPQVDPTATHERSRSVQSRGSVHEGVRTARSFPSPSSRFHIDLFTCSTVSESKTMDYTRGCILHRSERTSEPTSNIWPTFRVSKIDRDLARSRDYCCNCAKSYAGRSWVSICSGFA